LSSLPSLRGAFDLSRSVTTRSPKRSLCRCVGAFEKCAAFLERRLRQVAFQVYNVGFVALICVPLASLQWQSPATPAIATGVGTCFATVVSTAVLFSVKLWRLSRGKEKSNSTRNKTTYGKSQDMSQDKTTNSSSFGRDAL
jgi:hypothetical protein